MSRVFRGSHNSVLLFAFGVCKYFNRNLRHFRKPKAKTEILTADFITNAVQNKQIGTCIWCKNRIIRDNFDVLPKTPCNFYGFVVE